MVKIIGIDLGTSNSAAAVMMGGKPTLVPAAEGATVGGKAFPSVVAFSKGGDLLVGEPARRQAVTNLQKIPIIFTIFNLPPVFLIFQLATYEQHYHVKYILF